MKGGERGGERKYRIKGVCRGGAKEEKRVKKGGKEKWKGEKKRNDQNVSRSSKIIQPGISMSQ